LAISPSLRDVEELMAQRGIEVSREAIRCWVNKFGPLIAANLRRRRPCPTGRWHLDEMVCKIGGRRTYFWRAVDDEGEVLDVLVQKRKQQKFKSQGSAHRFLSTHAAVYNTFNLQTHLTRLTLRIFRAAAQDAWTAATVAA